MVIIFRNFYKSTLTLWTHRNNGHPDNTATKSSAKINYRAQLLEGRLLLTQGKNFNLAFFFVCSKAFSRVISSILFRKCNHQIVDNKNKTEFDL